MTTAGPDEGSSLLAAAQWLEGLVQGPLAVTLAVIAVAATGLMMLSGRLAVRRGLVVTLGCFVLFGAPAIARGLFVSAASLASSREPGGLLLAEAAPSNLPQPEPVQPQVKDPYAGASLVR
jgi:type IV secretory pathway VirB2 component (pilin)